MSNDLNIVEVTALAKLVEKQLKQLKVAGGNSCAR